MLTYKKIINEILKLPYFKNQAKGKSVNKFAKHENQIRDVLKKNKLSEVQDVKQLINKSFIHQPFGSQKSPDFLFKINNKIYNLECKSTSKTTPRLNGGLPKEDTVYVISSKKYNETTVLFNYHLLGGKKITKKFFQEFEKIKKEHKKIDNKFNKFGFMVEHKFRQDFNPKLKDFFTHPNKRKWVKEVLENK